VTNQAKCARCKGTCVNRWRVKGRVGGWSDPVECDRCGGHGTLVHQPDDDREPNWRAECQHPDAEHCKDCEHADDCIPF
jgi:DnaJ-class molecular chaperone